MENIIIGSGLAAIACADALIKRGAKVCIIDVGKGLEENQTAMVERMKKQTPQEWALDDIRSIKDPVKASPAGLLKKLVFGSEFVYSNSSDFPQITSKKCVTNFSLAKGGLSNAWGAAVLPYRSDDLEGWPITIKDLEPHYREILSYLPVVGQTDDVEKIFPIFEKMDHPLNPSVQANSIIKNYRKHDGMLNKKGIYCGLPRLAYYSKNTGVATDCVYCNLCVYGCPYELIFSSKYPLEKWEKQGNLVYHKNISINHLEESADKVIISGENLVDKSKVKYQAKRVFLAAGVFPTAAIILNSLKKFDQPVTLLDSQMFLVPYISFKPDRSASEEKAFTLSQLFMEIFEDADKDRKTCYQMQGYTYTDAFSKGLEHYLPKFILNSRLFKEQIFGRLVILQGFLPSKYSGSMKIQLRKKGTNNDENQLEIIGYPNKNSLVKAWKIALKLLGSCFQLGSVPAIPFVMLGNSGQSYHTGGTFPMKQNPGEMECDIYGRLNAYKRVHIIDGSILPSLAGSPFAFTVMANAHRIASDITLD